MAVVSIKKDQLLFSCKESIGELYLIMKGSFSLSFPGGEYVLSTGEIPGICELYSDTHVMTCRALEDSSVLVYPVSDISSLNALFEENASCRSVFARSAVRQMNTVLQLHELAHFNSGTLYTSCTQDYSAYLSYCIRYKQPPRKLNALSALSPVMEDLPLDSWSSPYYDGLLQLLSGNGTSLLAKEPAVLTGLIANTCLDFEKVLSSLCALAEYQKQALSLYINGETENLFSLYTTLYLQLTPDAPDYTALYRVITHMILQLEASAYINRSLLIQQITAFKCSLQARNLTGTEPDEAADTDSCSCQLADSLKTILAYAGMEEDFCLTFSDLITRYKNTADKNSSDDALRKIRQEITAQFYELYASVFFRAKEEDTLPLPVRMFLYFGYVDEQLAGTENTAFLSHAAESLSENSHEHIFTLFDWLKAIFEGRKEPSRNEFDEDYTDHLHALKVSGQISAAEEAALSKDMRKKVEYELKSMLPPVNKMTFGRISTFCPVFSAHNVLKQPEASFVSASSLQNILQEILSLDFSAFYREYVYSNVPAGIPREFFHTEVLPDIILMPVVGTRGVMWQEIEGRRRTTSARMMLPIFYLEDLHSAVIRLVGEYRWEMCKRVQGARWNDVADRSLTSEYFDYIQFFKKNHDLSADAKEKLKTALQKAHGSFKEMFVRDYITYILFEGTGSPRLNKPARTILFTYCPFAAKTRERLTQNPIYKDMLDHYALCQNQLLHKMDLLEKRVENTGNSLPKELVAERHFLNA